MNARAARRVWPMLTPLGTVFALSHAFRTVATIMAAPLRADLDASPQELGLVAGAFHLSFGALQLPVGVALDRYGPRRTVAVAFVAVVLGAAVSALAPTVAVLVAGQLGTCATPMLTLNQAADRLGVGPWVLRRLFKLGLLEATQVVPCAPWQIDPAVLDAEAIRQAAKEVERRKLRSGSHRTDSRTLTIPGT